MKKVRSNQAITLIALIITVIIMLILAGIGINMAIGDHGIFRKTQQGAQIYENAANNELNSLNNLDKELEDLMNQFSQEEVPENWKERNVKIKVNVTSFNESLGEFPLVFGIVATSKGQTVYDDVVEFNVTKAGTQILDVKINLPDDTSLNVTQLYCSPNYNLVSEESVQKTIMQDEEVEVYFEYTYQK